MEFVDLSRYLEVKNPKVLTFSVLKKMKRVWLTHDLHLVQDSKNIEYARSLAEQGIVVVPIRKKAPFSKYLDRDDFPRRVLLEMTSRCNFNCRMCPQKNLKRPKKDMPGELYRKAVDELDERGIEGLWIYHLGESILHPEFKENLRHISTKKNLGVIWMSTNGQFFNEEIIKTALSSNVDYINYSAHAITEETYKKVAPQGDFDTVQGNLEKLYELKGTENLPRRPFIHCQMIEQEVTKHEVDDFINKHYQKADIVSVNMLEYVDLENNEFGKEQRTRSELTSCPRITRNSAFVCSNGMVTPCDATYNGEICYGNINDNTLAQIWQSEERKKVIELNSKSKMSDIEFCNSCNDHDVILVGLDDKNKAI